MYKDLHGVKLKLSDFWTQFNSFAESNQLDVSNFNVDMSIDDAILMSNNI